jgi:hypothetical protein
MSEPIQTAPQTGDRDSLGRFSPGNGGGPGNPGIAHLAKHRARFAAKLKSKDMDTALRVIREVMAKGKDSDRLAAVRELLNRTLGMPASTDVLERIERLEELAARAPENAPRTNGNGHG